MIVASIKVKRSYGRKPVPHCAMASGRAGDVPTISPISVIYRELAERIDELAREYPSRNAFAEAAGMSRGVAYAWIECKRHPQAESLIRLCILLNVNPNWLLLGVGPKRPPEGQRIAKMVVDCHAQ